MIVFKVLACAFGSAIIAFIFDLTTNAPHWAVAQTGLIASLILLLGVIDD